MTQPSDTGPFYHGCKADLKTGDMLVPGFMTNYGTGKTSNFIYFSATLEAATWGAELAQAQPGKGDGRERIYIVEPTGPVRERPQPHRQEIPRQPDPLLPHPRRPSASSARSPVGPAIRPNRCRP